jgi:hypothetical protein
LAPGRPTARQLWVAIESIHAVTYFAPRCRQVWRETGLKGFWAGYFAARAAPLGAVGAGPVVAAFYNFHPAMVHQAIPACWDVVDPGRAIFERATAAARVPDELGCADLVQALPSLRTASAGCLTDGRVMAAANQALGPALEVGLGHRGVSPAARELAEVSQACTTLHHLARAPGGRPRGGPAHARARRPRGAPAGVRRPRSGSRRAARQPGLDAAGVG